MEDKSAGEYIGAIPLIASVDTAPRILCTQIIGCSGCSFTHTYPHSKGKKIVRFRSLGGLICLILSNR